MFKSRLIRRIFQQRTHPPLLSEIRAKALIAALIVFLATFAIRFYMLHYKGSVGAGDFVGPLAVARNLLQGLEPYTGIDYVPYPLPAAFLALPFTLAPDRLAGTLFFSVSAAILAAALVYKTGQVWRLLLVFSVPFVVAMEWTQWSVLVTAAWYLPVLAPLMVLVKPQTALPVFLNRWGNYGYAIAAIVLAISILVSPGWLKNWMELSRGYQYLIPILLPGGFLLALSVFNLQDKRARLLLAMALLPFRATYDLVPLFIIPETPLQMIILIVITWLTPVHMWYLVALVFILITMDIKTGWSKFLYRLNRIKEHKKAN